MNMLRRFTAPLAVAALLVAPVAWGESPLDFTLENRTGYTIKEIYISPAKKDTWGKVINKSSIKDGADYPMKAKATAKVQKYDLKAVYADGAGAPVWYDLDPTQFSRLTLKWDKEKKKTVAVKHRQ